MIYILDAVGKRITMQYVRVFHVNGRWIVIEGLTNR